MKTGHPVVNGITGYVSPEAFMHFKALLGKFSLVNKDLYYKLSVAVALFLSCRLRGFSFLPLNMKF